MKHDKEIRHLFSEFRYKVYNSLQRPYVWDFNRVQKLIDDIIGNDEKRKVTGLNIRHNIGDIITYNPDDEPNVKYIDDGAQRFTTLFLLFLNILHHGPDKYGEAIRGFITAPIWEGSSYKLGKRIELKESDDEILQELVLNGTRNYPRYKEGKKKRRPVLVENYDFISREYTDKMMPEELDEFCRKILENCSYFERECDYANEGYLQFNYLNGWNEPLTDHQKGSAALYTMFKNNFPPSDEIEKFLCMLSNMDNGNEACCFMGLFLYSKGLNFKVKDFPIEFDKLYKRGINVPDEACKFFNGLYADIVNHGTSDFYDTQFLNEKPMRVVYVGLYSDRNPVIKSLPENLKRDIYKKFEWGYISNAMLNNGFWSIDRFVGILSSYKTEYGDPGAYVEQRLRELDMYMDPNALKDITFSHKQKLAKNILSRAEYQYRRELNCHEPIRHLDIVSLEHIRPRTPKNNSGMAINPSLTYSLGNFTLMGKSANSSNSNKTFDEKRKEYAISHYVINSQHISVDYDTWDDDAIRNNTEWYIERLNNFYGNA